MSLPCDSPPISGSGPRANLLVLHPTPLNPSIPNYFRLLTQPRREFDLDKNEKLAKAEDFGKRALTLIPNMQKMDPSLTDEAWLMTKKDFMSQGNESLGMIALKRKDFPLAEEMLQKALTLAGEQTGPTFYYLAESLHGQGKKDEAMNAIDKSIAAGGLPIGDGSNLADELKQKIAAGS